MKIKKGFTLIEVLVTSLIVGIVGIGAVNVVADSNKILNNSAKESVINSNVNLLMLDISRDIKAGYRIDVDSPNYYMNILTITSRDPGEVTDKTVTWTNRYVPGTSDNYGWFCVRKADDGTEKVYKLIGGESLKGYRYLIMYFGPPQGYTTYNPSKYFGVNIRIESYNTQSGSDYWYYRTETTYFCRREPDSILI